MSQKGHVHRLVSVSCFISLLCPPCGMYCKALVLAESIFSPQLEAVNKGLSVQFSLEIVSQVNLLH